MATLEVYSSFEELKASRVRRDLTKEEELRQMEVAKEIKSIRPLRNHSV